jgi:hypothetical protein
MDDFESNIEYMTWLDDIKNNIKTAQVRTSVKANSELIILYWNIGKSIFLKQSNSLWGDGLIKQLSIDLLREFPEIKGFSERNLSYIIQWFKYYQDKISILQQPVAEIDSESISQKLIDFYKVK